ncbi:CBS domain-containing protein [Streptomyces sp. NPDC050121]|uniref:CBS domain-containing protein n=1 Tax=Streptomyces sp. NPDC050121 TaxID=3365601 RepID=UPI00379D600E
MRHASADSRATAPTTGAGPFLDVAHALAREQVNAVPVVDTDGHVIGVVSESKPAGQGRRHGGAPPARPRRQTAAAPPDKSHGDTAATVQNGVVTVDAIETP